MVKNWNKYAQLNMSAIIYFCLIKRSDQMPTEQIWAIQHTMHCNSDTTNALKMNWSCKIVLFIMNDDIDNSDDDNGEKLWKHKKM